MYAHEFIDFTGFWGFQIRRTFMPPFPAGNSSPCGFVAGETGGSYNFFLSGGSGPASGAGAQLDYYNGRFAGMIVQVTVSY